MPINEALAWLEQANGTFNRQIRGSTFTGQICFHASVASRRRAISTRRPRCTWPTEA